MLSLRHIIIQIVPKLLKVAAESMLHNVSPPGRAPSLSPILHECDKAAKQSFIEVIQRFEANINTYWKHKVRGGILRGKGNPICGATIII
jgi:hypothetical protein